ncbi:hypothetical protein C0991_000189 [Blastosporella zonata]|nr:hypothetical protein C0991_000189 [Blastosporella zonata]
MDLDECEFVAAALSDSRVVQHSDSFYFYGILEIKTLGWLSPQGKKILQDDLQRLGYPLDLATRYRNPRFKVSVWIQCVKNMPVRFLSEAMLNNIALILELITLNSSRNFLTRYRLWALLDDLIIQSGTPPTRIEERTIDWLVKQYLHRLQRKSNGRFARHVSRAEIIGMFAAHADWILAQHLASPAKNVQKVNLPKWIRFCTEVAAARLSARRACNSQGWGLPEGRATNETILDLSRFGKAPVEWKKLIDNALKREKDDRKLHRTAPKVATRDTSNSIKVETID